jgi:hypothetical protein
MYSKTNRQIILNFLLLPCWKQRAELIAISNRLSAIRRNTVSFTLLIADGRLLIAIINTGNPLAKSIHSLPGYTCLLICKAGLIKKSDIY